MTSDEVIKLLAWVTANFPAMQDKDLRPTAELWCRILSDIPYKAAEMGVLKILATAKYFPTVAEVREAALSFMAPKLPTPGEAWGEVLQAVQEYGFYRPDEALESLSPAVRRTVECIGWREVCLEDEVAVRAHFLRVYESLSRREQEMALMPAEIRQMIEAKQHHKELPAVGGEES